MKTTLCVFAVLLVLATCSTAQTPAQSGGAVWDNQKQGKFVTALAKDKQGQTWVGVEGGGVWRYNATAAAGQWTQFTTADGLGDDIIYAVAVDRLNRVWVGHLNHGVSVWNGQKWQNYGLINGPLGERVFDIEVSPVDGDVWMATDAGLARYSEQGEAWSYYTRADGLPSDQISCIAFDQSGGIYVGTQCDGLALSSPLDNYRKWQMVQGSSTIPNAPMGKGLPTNLINDVAVAHSGEVYVGTTCGLARSSDRGKSWDYVRGTDWAAKVKQQSVPETPVRVAGATPERLLAEDYVTCVTEDRAGRIWIGHRQKGYEVRDAKGRLIYADRGGKEMDYIASVLPQPQEPTWLGGYGGGVKIVVPKATDANQITSATPEQPVPPVMAALPRPAAPPTVAELEARLMRVRALDVPLPEGGVAYGGEDWTTAGDWVGRYGRRYAVLSAMESPASHELSTDADAFAIGVMGPHHAPGDVLRAWVQGLEATNPNALYSPTLGHRREAEWDDHAEAYPMTYEGPDIWVIVKVPEGVHRVSFYFNNRGGHSGNNRFRDYLIEWKQLPDAEDVSPDLLRAGPAPDQGVADVIAQRQQWQADRLQRAQAQPTLARARVRDFWKPVYKQFIVRGPDEFYVKIGKNNSYNTVLQAVMIDWLGGTTPIDPYRLADEMGGVRYHPPRMDTAANGALSLTPATLDSPLQEAVQLWKALDQAYSYDGSAALQWPSRLLSYRVAIATKTSSPSLLANWRWRLKLWRSEDRAEFKEVMSRAYAAYQNEQAFRRDKERIFLTGNGDNVIAIWMTAEDLPIVSQKLPQEYTRKKATGENLAPPKLPPPNTDQEQPPRREINFSGPDGKIVRVWTDAQNLSRVLYSLGPDATPVMAPIP